LKTGQLSASGEHDTQFVICTIYKNEYLTSYRHFYSVCYINLLQGLWLDLLPSLISQHVLQLIANAFCWYMQL